MPQFNPAEEKVAVATFPVSPAGLDCTAELWLGSNLTKVATSGAKPFVSTGLAQSISLPITMPATEGNYPVRLDVSVAGELIAAYQAIEDVVIEALLITPGWVVDPPTVEGVTTVPIWWAGGEDWGNIFRKEYVTIAYGSVEGTRESRNVGDTWTWYHTPLYYSIWTVQEYIAAKGLWKCRVEKHRLGLDSVEGREYWKARIPTDVPVAFAVYYGVIGDNTFRELENAGVADITNTWRHPHAPSWRPYFRVIIYDFDGFFDILSRYQWINLMGKIVE